MKLHSIELTNVRGIGRLTLDELPDTGVVVIAGDNETGKSTIAEAIHVALTCPAKSARKEVKALAPNNRDARPEVRLEMTLGGRRFSLHKVFAGATKQTQTVIEVTEPSPRMLTGEDAQQWLDELIRGEGTRELWDAFVARQGTEQKALQMGGYRQITATLQELSGGDADSAEAQSVLEAAKNERAKYYTAVGNEKTLLKNANSAVDEAEERYAEAKKRADAVRGLLVEAEENDRRQARLTASLPAAEKEVERWRGQVEELKEYRLAKERAETAERVAKVEFDGLAGQRAAREDLLAQRDASKEALAAVREALAPLREAESDEQKEVRRIDERATATAAERERARKLRRLAEDDLAHHGDKAQLEELDAVLGRVRALNEEVEERLRALAEHRITADDAKSAREAEHEWRTAREVMEASSPELSLFAEGGGEVSVDVDGEETMVGPEALVRPVTAETTVRAGGVAMTVRPGDGSGDHREREARAKAHLDDVLSNLGVSSVQSAEQKAEERAKAQSELDLARARRDAELENRDPSELADRRMSLHATVAAYPGNRADTIAEWTADRGFNGFPPLPGGMDEAREALEKAQAAEHAAEVAHEEAQQEQRTVADRPARHALRDKLSDEQARAGDVRRAEDALIMAREGVSDEDLEARFTAAREAHETAAAALAGALRALDERGAEDADASLRGAESNLERQREELRKLQIRRSGITGELRTVSGVNEELAEADAELTRLRRDRDSLRRRAEAAKLLYDVLEQERLETRKIIGEPLLAKLSQYGTAVFGPGTVFELTNDLAVKSRTAADGTHELEALSGGAQEQIDVLLRLAVAGLMDGEGGAPVIIDDALGYSDPDRLRRMNNALARAGDDFQVLVLTCYPERFARIPDSRQVHMADLLGAG